MADYVLVYHGGGMSGTPEEQAAEMAKWEAWYGELGAAIVDGGAPFANHKTVASDGSVSDGGGANPATGYTIISADSVDTAATLAKGCPVLDNGGSVEVVESIQM